MKRLFRKYQLLFVVFILIIGAGCNDENYGKEQMDQINAFLTEHLDGGRLDSLHYVVVIPDQGCAGCVNVAEVFYRDFSKRDDILFVFTNILSVKMLNYKLSINNTNTIIDTTNLYMNMFKQKEKIYPTAVVMKDGLASAILVQSPRQSGLRAIRNHLERNTFNQ